MKMGALLISLLVISAPAVALLAYVVHSSRQKKYSRLPLQLVGRVASVERALDPEGFMLVEGELWRARNSWGDGEPALREGEHVVVEQVHGLTLAVRRAEEWEVLP